jgi:hypothetical protein
MFAIAGITFAKMLPDDKKMKLAGIPNRWFFAVVYSVFCVVVELLLNAAGVLTWDYSWWNATAPFLIVIFGYLTFFIVSYWVLDMETVKKKMIVVGFIFGVDILAILIFGFILGWL